MTLTLRRVVSIAVLLAAGALSAQAQAQNQTRTFDFDDVVENARALAATSFSPNDRVPGPLRDLTYDQYRDIRFRPERALWRDVDLPFQVQFFHPGLYFDRPVKVNVISAQGVRRVRFDPDKFDYGKNSLDRDMLRELAGFAGLRIHYPLNNPEYKDELAVFQGASYFRALGRDQRYGLSARGLAIDTGELSGEEFPAFTEFWLRWPRRQDEQLIVYALLDSPRVTGAYRFEIHPGDTTRMQISSRLFFRGAAGKLGIAPLTSMYLYGENQKPPAEDYRPEVHDSDGLLVHTGNEWLWRPLVNPPRLLITSFGSTALKGFGLMQRDHKFDHYEDLEARYELRPSAWVQPRGDWGKGRVELVMIPTPDETNDNIVAYWVPEQAPKPGDSLRFDYELSWESNALTAPPLAQVTQTRRGHGWVRQPDDSLRFHLDFAGEALTKLPAGTVLKPEVWIGDGGERLEAQAYPNEVTGGWRLSLKLRRTDSARPLEMRAFLSRDGKPVTETWSYVLPPAAER